MDYCAGGSLSGILKRYDTINEDVARLYIAEITLAIGALHSNRIIFRDLKPDNVLLDCHGHIKLVDFGLSKDNVSNDILYKSFCGSPSYLAPEMLRSKGHTKEVDWYMLGVILYEMLVGKPPYHHSKRERMFRNILSGPLVIPSFVSPEASNLIRKLLVRDPALRLGSGPHDFEDVKSHEFFHGLDWEKVLSKGYTIPKPESNKKFFGTISLTEIFGDIDPNKNTFNMPDWSFINVSDN